MMRPVLVRELVTAARRRRTFVERVELAGLFALLAVAVGVGWWVQGAAWSSYRDLRRAAAQFFGLTTVGLMTVTIMYLPHAIAASLAGERDKRTLSSLLATSLPSRDIVLGVVGSALARYGCCMLVGLPVLLLLMAMGGVDPRLVLLAAGATLTLAGFVSALAVVIAVESPDRRQAAHRSAALTGVWMVWPTLLSMIVPRFLPRTWSLVNPVNEWIKASSPLDPAFSLVRGVPWSVFLARYGWMIGLQLLGAAMLVLVAILRLRPASRRLEERGAAAHARRLRLRPNLFQRRRRACGDDPMLWKELCTGRPSGWARLMELSVVAVLLGSLVFGLGYYIGWPAFREWREAGYSTSGSDVSRELFNAALRLMTAVVGFIALIFVAGQAGEGIAVERARDTWTNLLASPLEPREILRAKRLGAVWRARFIVGLIALLWTQGLASGSLHPLGVAAAAVALVVMLDACAAWGVLCSMRSRDVPEATNRTVVPLVVLSLSGLLPMVLPARFATIVEGAASPPLVTCVALVSPQEVRAATTGRAWEGRIGPATLQTEGPARHLACYVLGVMLGLAARAATIRAAERGFDASAGRPIRPPLPVPADELPPGVTVVGEA
jgi:ABC-type Na+ efflux pump permease subunit